MLARSCAAGCPPFSTSGRCARHDDTRNENSVSLPWPRAGWTKPPATSCVITVRETPSIRCTWRMRKRSSRVMLFAGACLPGRCGRVGVRNAAGHLRYFGAAGSATGYFGEVAHFSYIFQPGAAGQALCFSLLFRLGNFSHSMQGCRGSATQVIRKSVFAHGQSCQSIYRMGFRQRRPSTESLTAVAVWAAHARRSPLSGSSRVRPFDTQLDHRRRVHRLRRNEAMIVHRMRCFDLPMRAATLC